MSGVGWGALAAVVLATACSRDDPKKDSTAPSRTTTATPALPPEPPPQLLYLPDGGDIGPPPPAGRQILPGPWGTPSAGNCPGDMVNVRGAFCIDRHEASLVDSASGNELSPYYHPTRGRTQGARSVDGGTERAQTMPLPTRTAAAGPKGPKALSRAGAVPSGYLDMNVAALACQNAGKRLCTEEEWVTACRGEKNRKFPYGDKYEQGRCNVFREAHPAMELYGNPSIGHQDPRLNRVTVGGRPLLRTTGATPECKSEWGSDAVYDMVGNLDEWIDDPSGVFRGGFYSRSTKSGCDAKVSSHAPSYFDYSLGVRCCLSVR